MLARRRKTILLVEDDPFYKELFTRIAHHLPSHPKLKWVTAVPQAKRVFSRARYYLIIADYRLNGPETGLDLWSHCQSQGLKTPFLLISGRERELPAEGLAFLPKPLKLQECVSSIEAALAA